MRTAPEIVSAELRKVCSRKKAAIFYDSQSNARHALKLFLEATEEAGMGKDFEVGLYNLATLGEGDGFANARQQITSSQVALFALHELPSEAVLEWVDSWTHELPPKASLLVLLDSQPATDSHDHALLCSYFRAVAARGLRHYSCECCRSRLPAAPLPEFEIPAETLRARTHASIVCMNLHLPQTA